MISYRFFKLSSDDSYAGVSVRPFGTLDDAIAYAHTLNAEGAVEIWRGEEFVSRVETLETAEPA